MRDVPGDAELPSLVAAARRGDQAAWDALVLRFTGLVWAVTRGHGLPASAAVDVAHTTWLRLVESLAVAPDDAIGEWVAAIARAESVQALRWVDPRPDRRAGPPDPVWAAVGLLPARCRLALRVLAVTPAPNDDELAAALDSTPAQARAFVGECLERLAGAMADTVIDLTSGLQSSNDDDPPEALHAAARAAFSWRTADSELSRPSYDSLLDEALTPTRGGPDARLLRFDLGGLTLDLEVTADVEGRSLVGQVTPPLACELTVRHGGAQEAAVTTDDLGRFALEELLAGPFSLRRTTGDAVLTTDWVLI